MSEISIYRSSTENFYIQSENGEFTVSIPNRTIRPAEGLVSAGGDKNIIVGGQDITIFLKGSYSGNILGKTIQWSVVSGTIVSLSNPNLLSTFVTIPANSSENIILKLSIINDGGELSNTMTINPSPAEVFSGSFGLFSSVEDLTLFNHSFRGSSISFEDESVTQVTGGNVDTIFWSIPPKNHGGYLVQRYDISQQKWIIVEFGSAENDLGFFVMPELNVVYRYLPVWEKNGKQIAGYSDGPFRIKERIDGPLSGFFANFENISQNTSLNSPIIFEDINNSVQRFRLSKKNKVLSEEILPSRTKLSSSLQFKEVERLTYIKLPDETIEDSISTNNILLQSNLDSSSVSRLVYTLNTLPVGG